MSNQYFKAYNALIKMLEDRNYSKTADHTDYDLSHLYYSYDEFEALYESKDSGTLDISNIYTPTGTPVYVHVGWPNQPLHEINGAGLQDILKSIASVYDIALEKGDPVETNVLTEVYVILVYMGVHNKNHVYASPSILNNPKIAKVNEMKKLNKSIGGGFQMFSIQRLNARITEANIMPKFRILNSEERDKMGTLIKTMPKFAINDPIVYYYGANIGDVFEIVRGGTDIKPFIDPDTGTRVGRTVTYRVVRGVTIPKRK